MLCVFDCESVPDVGLLREVYGYSGSSLEVCERAFLEQKEQSGSEFLPLPFHQIISIAAVICDDYGRFIKVGNYAKGKDSKDSGDSKNSADLAESSADSKDSIKYAESKAKSSLDSTDSKPQDSNLQDSQDSTDSIESQILAEFLNHLNKNNPKLVSFNGRGFDLPLINLRSMRYNLSAFAYFESDNPSLNKNKWDNYRARYSENFHIDLLDTLGSFGAVRGMRLDSVCKMLKIPGKFDVSGDDVFALYYGENRSLEKIDEYCQSDVLNTYWLFLKYQLLSGKLILGDYADLLQIFLDKMPSDKSYSEVFKNSLNAELGRL
ncbi:hypothetical protein CCY99_08755 [Helicobacter sp. 16-1353]|uniref:3'-5' exonuclease n=1 Tax=Helicobacter sp. 16-1353 TaxID=2004996 RepID=UPI000DCDF02E|nr:3'-5' exonuclease [Helicobacter sp. 16-1353]RAX51639.1 hypothetical protein CCY99_08755 [Helicobacter sp. 16-1353]